MKHTSGSPTAWKLRREQYQKTQGPVSNPGQPSTTNRAARRWAKRRIAEIQSESR